MDNHLLAEMRDPQLDDKKVDTMVEKRALKDCSLVAMWVDLMVASWADLGWMGQSIINFTGITKYFYLLKPVGFVGIDVGCNVGCVEG